MQKQLYYLSQLYSLMILTGNVPYITNEINFILKNLSVPKHNLIIKEISIIFNKIEYFQSASNVYYFMINTWNYLSPFRIYFEV